MVEGDKWEMYIPMELAYGPNGKPPKIPPAAALIFQMEIIKIDGPDSAKVPKTDFPEWTPEQLALWTEKDEAACQAWRDGREKAYAEGKLNDKCPTREAFDAYLETGSRAAKNKSLWKRTRK